MVLLLASVSFALLISALCSLMEATLLSLTPTQVAGIATRRPQLGRIWKELKEPIDRPISVILIINTTAHTIGATVAGAEFDKLYGDRWIWIFSLVFTGLMLQFTEILPKTLGVRYGQQIAIWIGRPLRTLVVAFHPVIQMVRWINRPFERSAANGSDSTTLARNRGPRWTGASFEADYDSSGTDHQGNFTSVPRHGPPSHDPH